MSPWKSKSQQAWGHSPSGQKALGSKKVAEYDKATPSFKKLPEKAKPKSGKK